MDKKYEQLKVEDRVIVMAMRREGSSLRAVARRLQRAPSSISREVARLRVEEQSYDAVVAGLLAKAQAPHSANNQPTVALGT